jgi:hypothetical protein
MIITPKGGTGVTSEMSVRLHHVAAFHRQHGRMPDAIDGSQQFHLYRDEPGQNVSDALFAPVKQSAGVTRTDYEHGWQMAWYDTVCLPALHQMALASCAPNRQVELYSHIYASKAAGRAAVIYRGNDKAKEIKATPYDMMFAMARDTGASKFIVQTDELEFFGAFKHYFPDTIRFENMPMIKCNYDRYVIENPGRRVEFARSFFAILLALSQAPQLMVTTGNVGIWASIWRGNTDHLWQVHGDECRWRRLG